MTIKSLQEIDKYIDTLRTPSGEHNVKVRIHLTASGSILEGERIDTPVKDGDFGVLLSKKVVTFIPIDSIDYIEVENFAEDIKMF